MGRCFFQMIENIKGWLVGEETIAKKPAMVVAKLGEGSVVLVGFRTQHRAQTYGTFKLLFNSLMN